MGMVNKDNLVIYIQDGQWKVGEYDSVKEAELWAGRRSHIESISFVANVQVLCIWKDEHEKELAACEDCGLPYGEFPLDVVIPGEQWEQLTGYVEGEGLLCPTCIVKRAAKIVKPDGSQYITGKLVFE